MAEAERLSERGNRGPGRMGGGHKRPKVAAQSGAARAARGAAPTLRQARQLGPHVVRSLPEAGIHNRAAAAWVEECGGVNHAGRVLGES